MKNDLISRSALKKTLIKHYGEDDRSYDAAIALTAVQQAPTVAAAPKWISVEDGLPEELTPVLIFTSITEQGVCMAFVENGKWIDGYSGRGIALMQQELITHWMPLPEPPQEEGGEENEDV